MKKTFLSYCNRKFFILLMLGFASGLPISLLLSTLQAWFKTSGVDIVTIGFLSLIGQPYSYKFLWAPLLDRYTPSFLDRRRGWIFIIQLGIAGIIAAMAFGDPLTSPYILCSLGLILAFFSASQDIVFDAYKVEVLESDERGLGAAVSVEGYRLAMIVSGGGSLILADHYGWRFTYLFMSLLMGLSVIFTWLAPKVTDYKERQQDLWHTIVTSFKDFLTRDKAIYFLMLVIFYKLGDAFSHTLSTPFLLDLGFSLTHVGEINKFVGVVSSLLGIFFGGVLMTRMGLFKALMLFGILQALTNFTYMGLALVGKNYILAVAAFFAENLCGGMGTAAFIVLLMSLCNARYSATQYALFSSIAVLGRVYVGPSSGYMVQHFGWANFYLISVFFACPGLLLLRYLKGDILQLGRT